MYHVLRSGKQFISIYLKDIHAVPQGSDQIPDFNLFDRVPIARLAAAQVVV